LPTKDLNYFANDKERQLQPQERRQLALRLPWDLKEGKDPRTTITRMVGLGARPGEVGFEGKRRTLKFMSSLTVDLDTPVVWRYRAEFDERDLDIPVAHWTPEMQEVALRELWILFPEWGTRQRTYRKIGSTYVEYRSPLTGEELLELGTIPIFDAPEQ